MRFYKRLNKYKASNLELDMNTLKAYSYDWYVLGMQTNLGYIVNTYNYSPTTARHWRKLSSLLMDLGIKYVEVDAPKGLQDLESAIKHYKSEIFNLNQLINKKGSRKSTNLWRQNIIEKHMNQINLLKHLQKENQNESN